MPTAARDASNMIASLVVCQQQVGRVKMRSRYQNSAESYYIVALSFYWMICEIALKMERADVFITNAKVESLSEHSLMLAHRLFSSLCQ